MKKKNVVFHQEEKNKTSERFLFFDDQLSNEYFDDSFFLTSDRIDEQDNLQLVVVVDVMNVLQRIVNLHRLRSKSNHRDEKKRKEIVVRTTRF